VGDSEVSEKSEGPSPFSQLSPLSDRFEGIFRRAPVEELSPAILDLLDRLQREKRDYVAKLEGAKGDDVFKYFLLINASALEGYVAQTRLQAEQSFSLSKRVALAGFVLLAVGIGLGVLTTLFGKPRLDAAYLSSIAGILTEFTSGVFFYLYNRTLQQLNLFHDKMLSSQHVSMSLLANSLVATPAKKDESTAELAKILMSTATEGGKKKQGKEGK